MPRLHGNSEVMRNAKFEKEFKKHPLTKELPGPSWHYQPHPTYFYRHDCTYCGEPARTCDVIANLLLRAAKRPDLPRSKILVATCFNCADKLRRFFFEAPPTINERKRYIGVWLRGIWSHHRGPIGSTNRRILERRFMYALRAASQNSQTDRGSV